MGSPCPGCRHDALVPAVVGGQPAYRCMNCSGYQFNFKHLKKIWSDPERFLPGFTKMVDRNTGRCHFCGANVSMANESCQSCGYHFSIIHPRFGEPMLPATLGSIKLDYCPRSRDLWLDADELVELASLNNWSIWDGTGTPPPEAEKAIKRHGFVNSVGDVLDAIVAPIANLFR